MGREEGMCRRVHAGQLRLFSDRPTDGAVSALHKPSPGPEQVSTHFTSVIIYPLAKPFHNWYSIDSTVIQEIRSMSNWP